MSSSPTRGSAWGRSTSARAASRISSRTASTLRSLRSRAGCVRHALPARARGRGDHRRRALRRTVRDLGRGREPPARAEGAVDAVAVVTRRAATAGETKRCQARCASQAPGFLVPGSAFETSWFLAPRSRFTSEHQRAVEPGPADDDAVEAELAHRLRHRRRRGSRLQRAPARRTAPRTSCSSARSGPRACRHGRSPCRRRSRRPRRCSGRALRRSSARTLEPAGVRTIPSATSIATASRSPIAATNSRSGVGRTRRCRRRPARRPAATSASASAGERTPPPSCTGTGAALRRPPRRARPQPPSAGRRELDDVDEGGRCAAARRTSSSGSPASTSIRPKSPRRSRTAFPSSTSTAGRIAKSTYQRVTMVTRWHPRTAEPRHWPTKETESSSRRSPRSGTGRGGALPPRPLHAVGAGGDGAPLAGGAALDEGLPYQEVARAVGASTTTVTRVAHWLRHGEGGYRWRSTAPPVDPPEDRGPRQGTAARAFRRAVGGRRARPRTARRAGARLPVPQRAGRRAARPCRRHPRVRAGRRRRLRHHGRRPRPRARRRRRGAASPRLRHLHARGRGARGVAGRSRSPISTARARDGLSAAGARAAARSRSSSSRSPAPSRWRRGSGSPTRSSTSSRAATPCARTGSARSGAFSLRGDADRPAERATTPASSPAILRSVVDARARGT